MRQNLEGVAVRRGLVVANHGRHCWVESEEGQRLICHLRSKKNPAVVGDRVWWQASRDEGAIERIEPRRNRFYRQDEVRTKSLAANLDQVLVLVAAEPKFSMAQLSRILVAAEDQHIPALIALNKADLAEPYDRAWARLEPLRRLHYKVVSLALRHHEMDGLALCLRGKTTLLVGPSGVGKSTLVNCLVPDAKAATGDLSVALASGRHTTTCTTWYWVDAEKTTALLDSPGVQEFGIHHVDPVQLANDMPDIRRHASRCKFYNCTHVHEPGCAVIEKIGHNEDGISTIRYKIYCELYAELTGRPHWAGRNACGQILGE